ncbi:MAG: hypothetical protein ABR920_08435 [Terriglobales bacterium]
MRRLLTIAAFVILVALVSASAQRGGMRAPGGARGVAVGHPSGGHAFSGMHPVPSARPSFRGNGFGGVRIRTGGFHHCYGCRRHYGYSGYAGYGYAGYYSPYWWWDSSSSYNYDEERELALASEMNALSLEEQRLRQQEDRERERERDQDLYARRSQPREEERAAAVVPATALVFRDQHVEEVRNYAIAGGTLWVLNEQAAKKIPLAQLDLAATARMNDDRGVDFQVPK